MAKAGEDLVHLVREGIRETMRQSLRDLVQEATKQELRIALREKDIRKNILGIIRHELQTVLGELRTTRKRPSRRS